MKRLLILLLWLSAWLGIGCVGTPTTVDDERTNTMMPSSSSPPTGQPPPPMEGVSPDAPPLGRQDEPPVATRPGGGSGATPATYQVGGLFDEICLARFASEFEEMASPSGEIIFQAQPDATYPVATYTRAETGVAVTILYPLDEDADDGVETHSDDGVVSVELGESTPTRWATLQVSAPSFEALPVTVDCDLTSALPGTAVLSTMAVYSDEALSNFACELVAGTTVAADVDWVQLNTAADEESVVFRIDMGPLAEFCEGSETTYVLVATDVLDGQGIVGPSIAPVLLKAESDGAPAMAGRD
ncbi:MAG: hypothetical protein VX589_08170 [Myxococcota bacterium]|nr:hypothetical protein [Myxococcota bacterium]